MAKLTAIEGKQPAGVGEPEYTISELAAKCEVTQRAIRFYEDQHLLAPRRLGQIRIFSRRDRVQLELILRGKRLGFSLAAIKEMLDLYEVDDDHVQQLRVALDKGRRRIAELVGQQQDIASALAELRELERHVAARLREKGIDPEEIVKSDAA